MTVTAMLNVDPASAEAPAPAAPPTADQAQDENDPVPSAVAAEDDPVPVAPTPAPVPRTFNCRAGRENCMVKGPQWQCLQSSVVYGAAVKSTETTLRSLFGEEEEVETMETYSIRGEES